MSFSKEFRYRNLGGRSSDLGRPEPVNYIVVGVIAAVFVVICGCLGVIVGLRLNGKPIANPFAAALPGTASRTPPATATASLKGEVPLKSRGASENGMEMTVVSYQRPLQVQGLANPPANQQFVLVSIAIRNTNRSGNPISINPGDFKLKGDGGLTYDANPKSVTIQNLATAQDQVAPGNDLARELIFQIASDDAGLKLYWTVGKTTRVFVLEP